MPPEPNDQELPEDVRQALNSGRKIDAIRLYRQHTGIGLKESRQVVEAYVKATSQVSTLPKNTGYLEKVKFFVALVLLALIVYFIYANL